VATVGNPGLHMPTWLGSLPGFSALATKMGEFYEKAAGGQDHLHLAMPIGHPISPRDDWEAVACVAS
jgi:hypothetical protein